ncbi:MAG: phage portal protein [Planctomycetaceae bacterium]|nr:phage portal protein [Planctomycetaceae bacterium]
MNIIDKAATWWLTKSVNIAQVFKVLRSQAMGDAKKASMPYRQVDVVFSCVEKLLSVLVGGNVPLRLSTVDEEIVEAGPVYDRLYGNPDQPFDRFASDWYGNYILFRDVFIRFDNSIADSSYDVIGGPRMVEQLNYSAGQVDRWQYIDDFGRVCYCTPQQVRQTRNFNPHNRFHGTGPLAACDNAIQYCYSLILRNASAMRNGAEMGVVLEAPTGANLTPEQISAILGAFDSRYAGPDKTMSTALLTGGMTAKQLALKMVDLQASEIDQAQACRIAAAIGVRPELVGLVTEAQYSGGPAMRDFIFNSAMPISSLFASVITDTFCQRGYPSETRCVKYKASKCYDARYKSLMRHKSFRQAREKAMQSRQQLFAWFDWSQHPVVQEASMDWTTKVLAFTDKGIALNDIIEAHDLPYKKQPWGDEVLTSIGQVTVRSIINGTSNQLGDNLPEGTPEPTESEEKSQDKIIERIAKHLECCEHEKAADDKRNRIWQKWAASWQVIEQEYQESLRGLFRQQRKELIAKLQTAMGEKAIKADTSNIVARVVFDLQRDNGKLKVIHRVFFEKASKLGAAQTLTETAGLAADNLKAAVQRAQLSSAVRRSLEISSTNITKVNENTQKWVSGQLREGLEAQEGLKELTDRLASEAAGAFGRGRAGTIARTQTSGAVSSGRFAGLEEAGVEKKGWLTSRDKDVRPEHRQAERQYADGIPMNQPFVVGGQKLMYPGDPNGSAAMVSNCRCLLIAVFAQNKAVTLDDYDRMKFVNYDIMKTLLNEA